MIQFLHKIRKYLLEVLVIFLGVMLAFIAENWRENLQDKADFRMIMHEIEKNIRLDSIEMLSDKRDIIGQLDCIDKLLNEPLSILGLPKGSLPNRTCLDIIMFYDWPDYVTTGYHQLENSKIVPAGFDEELMMKIYEYYQWIDYHYLLVEPTIRDVQKLQQYFIDKGFPPIEKDSLTERDVAVYERLQKDTVFVTMLKYLKYNRKLELRVYKEMQKKSSAILESFKAYN
ncbi:hypothetical protein ACT6NV_08990 [Robiginitalea sp. IMCC44478]|uniref:hypothetical protein n=1 Tax=Robiginitalea sp. IMCC44478 TaxID=3459122 RepID=UPI00404194B0